MTTDQLTIHKPVLLEEVLAAFGELKAAAPRFLDGTFGRGGHTRALLKKFETSQVVAFDKDPDAIVFAKEKFKTFAEQNRFEIIYDDFKNLAHHSIGHFDGILLDLGVSSPQFDNAERGFSFMVDGPLDMRMNNQGSSLTAREIINEWGEKDLSDLFYHGGEVKRPNRVVRAIVHDRKIKPFETTRQLASLIERVDGFRSKGHHPATNYFLALRLAVNGELEGLEEFLKILPQFMKDGGRLCVISFHSLEDRIVKNAFREMHKKIGMIVNKKVIIAGEEELEVNRRARSAKLRIFEKGLKNES